MGWHSNQGLGCCGTCWVPLPRQPLLNAAVAAAAGWEGLEPPPLGGGTGQRFCQCPLLSLLHCTETVAITFSLHFLRKFLYSQGFLFYCVCRVSANACHNSCARAPFPWRLRIRLDCSTRVLDFTVSANTSMEHTALNKSCLLLSHHSCLNALL